MFKFINVSRIHPKLYLNRVGHSVSYAPASTSLMLKKFRKVFAGNELERVNGLTLEDEVGSGTYSKVYRGSWRKDKSKTKLKVAIKVVDEHTASADFITNFLPREIEISKKIEHRNLLKTMDYFSLQSKTYIVTELARFDLLQYLRLKGIYCHLA